MSSNVALHLPLHAQPTMAESSSNKEYEVEPKFPGPVTFKEDTPRKGFFSLHLGMKEMTVNKGMLGLGKSTPKNAVIKPPVFTAESLHFKVIIQISDGNPIVYEYKKQMPEDIDPDGCTYKVKDGRLVVIIAKKKNVSWEMHGTYLCKPS